jgi:hypothetical protein
MVLLSPDARTPRALSMKELVAVPVVELAGEVTSRPFRDIPGNN